MGKIVAQEVTGDNKALSNTTLNDYELTDKQYAAWKTIKNNWIVSDFEAIKTENNVKMNCKNCEAFYIDVIIKINASGKLEYYKMLDGKYCGIGVTKKLELRFMRNFFKFEYPAELRNVTFQTRLGNVLKC
ncbi:MAG: hypothetical protein ACXVPU_18660 [Bacteroidia bacterium]